MQINLGLKIPRGNTQKNVNKVVVTQLIHHYSQQKKLSSVQHLDLPCGEGQLAKALTEVFPTAQVTAVDLFTNVPAMPRVQFSRMGVADFLSDAEPEKFHSISCVSGVMCFDGLPELFQYSSNCLKSGGLLVVSNDNVLTVRDRLSFLFFGELKRFKILYKTHEGNWNAVLPQALFMFFERSGFKNIQIQYTSFYVEDLLFLPLAILLFPLMILRLALARTHLPFQQRMALFPFWSLMGRHYVMSGIKS